MNCNLWKMNTWMKSTVHTCIVWKAEGKWKCYVQPLTSSVIPNENSKVWKQDENNAKIKKMCVENDKQTQATSEMIEGCSSLQFGESCSCIVWVRYYRRPSPRMEPDTNKLRGCCATNCASWLRLQLPAHLACHLTTAGCRARRAFQKCPYWPQCDETAENCRLQR